jgi:hypothetical protein
MLINELIPVIEHVVFKNRQEGNAYSERKIFALNEHIYYFLDIFTELIKSSFDDRMINGSHEQFMIHQIECFVEETVSQDLMHNRIKNLIFNADQGSSYFIDIIMYKIIKENEFINIGEISAKKYKEKKDEIYYLKWKNKIYTFLLVREEWTDLTNIVHGTRGLKDPMLRHKILYELVQEKKIIKQHDISGKSRIKTLYKYNNA